jgi:hypothetical protein
MLMLRALFFGYFSTIVVAVALNTGPISAADLNGSCCGDLEQRIAELEATTANKGDRKMSLSIIGQVRRVILWWDDGRSSGTFYGLDSTDTSSRFIFLGSGKLTPKVKVGFEIMIDIRGGGTTAAVSQLDEDGKLTTFIPNVNSSVTGPIGIPSLTGQNADPFFGEARRIAWWIENEDIGRLTMGRYEMAGVWGTIDLTGHVFLVGSAGFTLLNGGFFIRGPTGQYYAMVWGNIGDPASGYNRTELVRYDSPSWKGFIYSASVAEAGDYWGTMLRYFREDGGFRVAAQIGYERVTDIATPGVVDPANLAYVGAPPNGTGESVALSTMHLPTGLFVQGHYVQFKYGGEIIGAPSGYAGETTVHKEDVLWRLIQGGISKNWFGYGATSLYGEYGAVSNAGADITNAAGTTMGRDYLVPANTTGFTPVQGVTSTELRVWGVGIVQDFDAGKVPFSYFSSAAHTTVYLGYRHFDGEVRWTDHLAAATCSGGVPVTASVTSFTTHKLPTEPLGVIVTGARVRF